MTQEVMVYHQPDAYESVNERYVLKNVIKKVLVNEVEPLNQGSRTLSNIVMKNVMASTADDTSLITIQYHASDPCHWNMIQSFGISSINFDITGAE